MFLDKIIPVLAIIDTLVCFLHRIYDCLITVLVLGFGFITDLMLDAPKQAHRYMLPYSILSDSALRHAGDCLYRSPSMN
jgi:hypothetical protein